MVGSNCQTAATDQVGRGLVFQLHHQSGGQSRFISNSSSLHPKRDFSSIAQVVDRSLEEVWGHLKSATRGRYHLLIKSAAAVIEHTWLIDIAMGKREQRTTSQLPLLFATWYGKRPDTVAKLNSCFRMEWRVILFFAVQKLLRAGKEKGWLWSQGDMQEAPFHYPSSFCSFWNFERWSGATRVARNRLLWWRPCSFVLLLSPNRDGAALSSLSIHTVMLVMFMWVFVFCY